jgi:hypothetical protein
MDNPMDLILQNPDVVLRENLALSEAVRELNMARAKAGSNERYFWSYVTNHAVDSTPYYYLLWRTTDTRTDATLVAKALAAKMANIIMTMATAAEPKPLPG